jgi:hypothetical protein
MSFLFGNRINGFARGGVVLGVTVPVRSSSRRVILSEAEIARRLAICSACEHNQKGFCAKCNWCGGRKIAYKVQAATERCPLTPAKWVATMLNPTNIVFSGRNKK